MSKAITKIICFAVFFVFASSLLAIEVPLRYVKYPDKPDTYLPTGMGTLVYKLDPPQGEWQLPKFVSAHPIYSLVKLGDEERLLILDRQKRKDEYYNRIYFDSNGNRDLNDDPVIDGKAESIPGRQYERILFPPLDTEIKIAGKSLRFSFRPDFLGRLIAVDEGNISEQLLNKMIYLYLRVNCMYQGKFQVDGESFYVYIADSNCNGKFDEKFALRNRGTPFPSRMPILNTGDNFFISQNEEIGLYDRQICGDWLLIKNKLFEVNIIQSEEKMTLTPVNQNLAPLTLSMQPEHITFYTEGGRHFLMTFQPDKKIEIPKGKYRIFDYKLLKRDDQGDLWSLSARATTESPWITLDGGNDSVLKFGEPFVVSASVPESRRNTILLSPVTPDSVYLSFNMRGKNNEDIQDLSHIKGTNTKIPLSKKEGLTHRPKEPTYEILLANGKIAAQGSFEYG